MSDDTDAFARDAELRRRNRATVESYLEETKGRARLNRHRLFAENASAGLWTSDTGEPIMVHGKDRLASHAEWSLTCFPDWHWFNIEVYETQDPGRFWVECDGEGLIRFPGYPEGHYKNHFLHYFQLEDGLIVQNREFMNPFNQARALGLEVPRIRREGIPT